MIGYVTLGTNDMDRALPFYDAVLSELGARRSFANDHLQFYASKGGMFAVGTPFDLTLTVNFTDNARADLVSGFAGPDGNVDGNDGHQPLP